MNGVPVPFIVGGDSMERITTMPTGGNVIIKATLGTTGIETVKQNIKAQENVWYDLKGHRLTRRPTQQGVYINSGKKIFTK